MDIANIPSLSAADLMAKNVVLTTDYFDVAEKGLPMSSDLVSTTLASGNNYYGYTTEESANGTNLSTTPLPLKRNVARVEIADVVLDMAQSDYISGSASFQFTGVKINSAAANAKISGVDAANTNYVSYTATDYSFYGDFPTAAIAAVSQNKFTTATTPVTVNPIKAYYYVLANTQKDAENKALATATTLVV